MARDLLAEKLGQQRKPKDLLAEMLKVSTQPQPTDAGLPQQITTPETAREERIQRTLPRLAGGTGQLLGSIGGIIGGAATGQPFKGQVAGGTAGRLGGELAQEQVTQLAEDIPQKGFLSTIQESVLPRVKSPFEIAEDVEKFGIGKAVLGSTQFVGQNPIDTFFKAPPERQEEIANRSGIAFATELATAGVGAVARKFGGSIVKSLLGERVSERAEQVGWKALLDKEFYTGRVAKDVSTKMSKFFSRVGSVTGKAVEKAVKAKNIKFDLPTIQNRVVNILPRGKGIQDLDITSIQQDRLSQVIANIVDPVEKKTISTLELWNMRKNIDKLINQFSWSDEALGYMNNIRGILNSKIISAGGNIKKSFITYSGMKQAEQQFGNNVKSIAVGDDRFAVKLEGFMKNLLSTSKDETIALLKKLDSFLNADNKVVERLLNNSAAESLQTEAIGFGPMQKVFLRVLGGTKTNVARVASFFQHPAVELLGGAVKGILPTTVTELSIGKPEER